MATLENRPVRNPHLLGKERVIGVIIEPSFLSSSALREIARYQIFTDEPTQICVFGNGEKDLISRKVLTNARRLFGQDRKQFLDSLSVRMQKGKHLAIIAMPKIKKMLDIPKQINSKPNQNSLFRKFVDEEMK